MSLPEILQSCNNGHLGRISTNWLTDMIVWCSCHRRWTTTKRNDHMALKINTVHFSNSSRRDIQLRVDLLLANVNLLSCWVGGDGYTEWLANDILIREKLTRSNCIGNDTNIDDDQVIPTKLLSWWLGAQLNGSGQQQQQVAEDIWWRHSIRNQPPIDCSLRE